MKYFFCLILLFLLACKEEKPESNNPVFEDKMKLDKDWSFSKALAQTIKIELSIEENEKYDSTTVFAHLNDDGVLDAVTTVCLLDRALVNASKNKNPAKAAEIGYVGNYNYFFIFDGASKRFSGKKLVASSPKKPLKVDFCNIESMKYKTLTIEHRLNNAIFKSWFSFEGNAPMILFQWKIFEKLGTNKFDLKTVEYKPNPSSPKEDLQIYDGKMLNESDLNETNFYQFSPVIEKTGSIIYNFHYDVREKAYMIPKTQVKEAL